MQSDGASVRQYHLTGRIAQLLPHLIVTSDFLAILVNRRKAQSNLTTISTVVGLCLSCTYEVEIPPLISQLDDLSAWFRTLRRDMNGVYVASIFPVLPFYKCGLYQPTEPPALAPDHLIMVSGSIEITASTKGYLIVWSLITALEQPIVTKRESSTMKLLILCGTWLASIYILGSLYKGDMVSVLTSRTPQQVPNTLKDLVTSNTTIFTNHFDNLDGPPPISRCGLHDLVIPQLMNAITSKYTLHDVLTRLRRSSKCVKIFNVYEMSKNISNYGILTTNFGTEFIIPNQFVFVDPTYVLTSIQSTILLFPTYLSIRNGEIPFYTELKPWIISANFFGPRFISGLASLVESGIYSSWSNNAKVVSLLIDIYGVKGVGNISKEFAKISFAKAMKTKLGVMTAVPISFDKLRIPIVICLFFAGIGIVFLSKELI
ncbi:hypothetical protein Fcan01_27419 [Folsomia candida]|uniref:Uncharacterized protein n=1 Tax=Folsomia candida TaxID=158441 RepID=A0A226CZ03_FOLCA|nr:hypothetical protein Fcan01_27419 [Folsomia candida]